MKSIKAELKLRIDERGAVLVMQDISGVVGKLVEIFNVNTSKPHAIDLQAIITKPKHHKTRRQLGYWRAEVLPKVAHGLRQLGYAEYDDDKAEAMLIAMFLKEELVNKHGEIITVPVRVSGADEEQMSLLIDLTLHWAKVWLGVKICSPLQYYEHLQQEGKLTNEQWMRLNELREKNENYETT